MSARERKMTKRMKRKREEGGKMGTNEPRGKQKLDINHFTGRGVERDSL